MWRNLRRIIRSGFINFWRNGTVSIASLLVATITLSVISALLLSQAVLQNALTQIENKVDITVYFTTDAQESDILNLQSRLEALPEVKSVTYVSAAQSLADFQAEHADDYLTLQALDEIGGNPLGAVLNISAKDPAQYDSISEFLQNNSTLSSDGTSIIDKIDYNQNKDVINRLVGLIAGARELGLLVTLILLVISILIMFNTIRLTIFFAREEIAIMRLVGAARRYIRGPFLVEGMLYGFFATVLSILLFIPATMWLGNHLGNFLGINAWEYYRDNIVQFFLILLTAGIFLGVVSSFLATRKYLQK